MTTDGRSHSPEPTPSDARVLSPLVRRLAVSFADFYAHKNGVVPEPTEESLLWAQDFIAIAARAGLALVEAELPVSERDEDSPETLQQSVDRVPGEA